jgi:tellurium resistance protein TerZ
MSTVNLTKGQSTTITAEALTAGAGWIAPTTKVKKAFGVKIGGGKQKEVDLDLLAVAEDFDGDPVAVCWYSNMDSFEDGTLVHTGDNQDGKAKGDDESIVAKLKEFPTDIRQVTFMVAALKPGSSLQDVEAANLSLYDYESGEKIVAVRVKLNEMGNVVAVASATRKDDNQWEITSLNKYGNVQDSRISLLNFARQVSNF